MNVRAIALALLAAATAPAAVAGDRVDLTPPLYRELARETAAVRPASELATTPRVVAAARPDRPVVEATALTER